MNIKDILAAKGGVGPLRAQIHQLFADSCHPFRNFPNSPSNLSAGASPEALRLSQPQLWQRIEQLQEAAAYREGANCMMKIPPAHILSGNLASGSCDLVYGQSTYSRGGSHKCVSNLGSRTVDKAQQTSKEVKKAFKATVYPASRHEESRGVWGVYGRYMY